MTARFVQVVLAAGEGRRAGGYKPLFPFAEGRVIDRVIVAGGSLCSEIRVVGGANFEALQEYLKQNFPAVRLIHNSSWKEGGMFSSVLCGLADVKDPVFIHPADIPGPSAGVYRRLSSAFKEATGDVYRPVYQNRAGHPILLSESAVAQVRSANPSSNLRMELANLKKVDVPVDSRSVLHDLDTRDDFNRLEKLLEGER